MKTVDATGASEHLSAADPKLAALISRVGDLPVALRPTPSVFAGLAEAIVHQQLSTKAAATIYGRVCALAPGGSELQPSVIIQAPDQQLRGCGVSRAKTLALRDLAERVDRGDLPTLARLRKMSDDDIVVALSSVRGIGRWSAQMFLIFRLGRPDVLPADDLGLRRGYSAVFGGPTPTPQAVLDHGERWRPHRTTASWYLWHAADGGGA